MSHSGSLTGTNCPMWCIYFHHSPLCFHLCIFAFGPANYRYINECILKDMIFFKKIFNVVFFYLGPEVMVFITLSLSEQHKTMDVSQSPFPARVMTVMDCSSSTSHNYVQKTHLELPKMLHRPRNPL